MDDRKEVSLKKNSFMTDVKDRFYLQGLPANSIIYGSVEIISDNPLLFKHEEIVFPKNLIIQGNLTVIGYQVKIDGLLVKGNLDIHPRNDNEIIKFESKFAPKLIFNGEIIVEGNFNISRSFISFYPCCNRSMKFKVLGDIDISYTLIRDLPKDLKIYKSLNIVGTKITEIPLSIEIKETLYIGDMILENFDSSKINCDCIYIVGGNEYEY